MFERSVGKKPVPYIASSRTSTGGITGTYPFAAARSSAKRYSATDERGIPDHEPEARAGEACCSFHLEPPDLRVLGPRRGRLADAADLDGVLLRDAVGRRRVGRVRHLGEQLVARGLRRRQLRFQQGQLRLHLPQLLELLRRR